MPESWVNLAESLGADLHLELTGPGSRRAVLIRALRDAIRSGRLAPGTRLPPYRSLAADLGIARNTVADAYAELVAEGWLSARQGSGTRVAHRAQPLTPTRAPAHRAPVSRPTHNLLQGQPDAASFPRTAWLAAARRALTAAPHDAFGPGDPRGRPELRRALADYLARTRGVRTDPERIVICSGFAHALRLLLPAVLPGPLAVESYGLPFHRHLLATAGLRTHPRHRRTRRRERGVGRGQGRGGGAAHPGSPIPARRAAAPGPPGRGHQLGEGERKVRPRRRLRR